MKLSTPAASPGPGVSSVWAIVPEDENEEGVPVERWDRTLDGDGWMSEYAGPVRHRTWAAVLDLRGQAWTTEVEAEDAASNYEQPSTPIPIEGEYRFTGQQLREHDMRVRANAEAAMRESLEQEWLANHSDGHPVPLPAFVEPDPGECLVSAGFREVVQDVVTTWNAADSVERISAPNGMRVTLDRLSGAVRAVWGT